MENEENRGAINKKAYEDQFVTFCEFNFGALIFYSLSLSYSWKLRVSLEHSWRVLHTWSFRAIRKKKSKKS